MYMDRKEQYKPDKRFVLEKHFFTMFLGRGISGALGNVAVSAKISKLANISDSYVRICLAGIMSFNPKMLIAAMELNPAISLRKVSLIYFLAESARSGALGDKRSRDMEQIFLVFDPQLKTLFDFYDRVEKEKLDLYNKDIRDQMRNIGGLYLLNDSPGLESLEQLIRLNPDMPALLTDLSAKLRTVKQQQLE